MLPRLSPAPRPVGIDTPDAARLAGSAPWIDNRSSTRLRWRIRPLQQQPTRVTSLLARLAEGDAGASQELLDLLYEDLRGRAAAVMGSERGDHTLQPTALVHEAWMKLAGGSAQPGYESRAHFLGVAARAMRQALVDHARRKGARKRDAGAERITLAGIDAIYPIYEQSGVDLLDLEEALSELAQEDPELASLVELRFFGGLEVREVAELLGVSHRRIERGWTFARTWLRRRLGRGLEQDHEH